MINIFLYMMLSLYTLLYYAFSGHDFYVYFFFLLTKAYSDQLVNHHQCNKSDTDFVILTNTRKLFGSM